MAAGKLNIFVEQGATWTRTLELKDSESNPINITGKTFRGQIRKSAADPNILAAFTFSITSGSGGVVQATLSATTTTAIPGQNCVYDMEMVDGSTVTRILEGVAFISPNVTR